MSQNLDLVPIGIFVILCYFMWYSEQNIPQQNIKNKFHHE